MLRHLTLLAALAAATARSKPSSRAEIKGFYEPKTPLGTKDQGWTTPLPAAKRLTREYMKDGANRYFDAFAKNHPAIAPFATPCNRWEGGMYAMKDGERMQKNLC